MRIAFISDIHSAAAPYAEALRAARAEGFDRLIILGDLLTYGPDPERCIDLTREAVEQDGAVLIQGNHDILYMSQQGYDRALREWVQESVDWTRDRVGAAALDGFDWLQAWSEGPLLASHANPYGAEDWAYLRMADDYERAEKALAAQGFTYGVFGHVHRSARFAGSEATVFTLGSIGQPRSREDPRPQWAMGQLEGGRFSLSQRPLDFDWSDHCRALHSTNMSRSTVEQLCRFYI